MLKNTRHKLAAAVMVGAVTLGAGGAVAWAQTSGGSTSTTAPAAPQARAGIRRAIRTAVHGDVAAKDKSGAYVTVTFDRGTVTATSATSITISRADGQTATLAIDTNTKVHGVA